MIDSRQPRRLQLRYRIYVYYRMVRNALIVTHRAMQIPIAVGDSITLENNFKITRGPDRAHAYV